MAAGLQRSGWSGRTGGDAVGVAALRDQLLAGDALVGRIRADPLEVFDEARLLSYGVIHDEAEDLMVSRDPAFPGEALKRADPVPPGPDGEGPQGLATRVTTRFWRRPRPRYWP